MSVYRSRADLLATIFCRSITLCCLKHATQLIQALLRPMHVVVRDEVPIARQKRCQNEVSGQLLAKWEAQLLQPLSVINYFDHMWPNC